METKLKVKDVLLVTNSLACGGRNPQYVNKIYLIRDGKTIYQQGISEYPNLEIISISLRLAGYSTRISRLLYEDRLCDVIIIE